MEDGSSEYVVKAEHTCVVTHDNLPLSASPDRNSKELAQLRTDAKVMLEGEDTVVQGRRVRAKVAGPSGWISTKIAGSSPATSGNEYVVRAVPQVGITDNMKGHIKQQIVKGQPPDAIIEEFGPALHQQ